MTPKPLHECSTEELLTEAFRLARDLDFFKKLKTGTYWNATDKLIDGIYAEFNRDVQITQIRQRRWVEDGIHRVTLLMDLPASKEEGLRAYLICWMVDNEKRIG
jgi:hypothetical protein